MSTDSVNPATVEIIRNQLVNAAEEMQNIVINAAYEPLWHEAGDLSSALLNHDGEIIGQSRRALPGHIATMTRTAQGAIKGTGGIEALEPGDVLIQNDPYSGNNHLPDFFVAQPVLIEGELLGFSAVRGHWKDVGGAHASSYSVEGGEIIKEGLRVPPSKLYHGGDRNEDLFTLILANVRDPSARRGDLNAQLAGMRRGHERLIEMVENFGLMTLSETIRTVLENDEERMRNRIDDLPDGRYEAIDHLDGDGVTEGLVPIRVELVVDGDEIEVDFAGTAEQVKTSINCPVSATEAAVHYAVKVTLDPGDPGTLGAYRPISVSAPEGSLLNPRYPAPVTIGSHETCTRVYDVTLRAIAEIDARLAYSAGEGSSNVLIYESLESGKFNYTSMAGGMGACFNRDGVNAIRSGVGNTGPQPIERVEEEYDYVHFESFSIVPDSGGAGEHRGGATTRRVLRVDDETRITTATDRTKTQPFGLAGGDPGAAARHVHVAPDGEETVLDAKSTTIVSPGSRIILQPAGGGGYGLPENRPRETVLADVRDGYISPEAAALEYDIDVNDEDGDTY